MVEAVPWVFAACDFGGDGGTSDRIGNSFGVAGLPLLVSSSAAFCPEKRWNRLLPPFQFAFAVVLTMFPVLAVE